eukprot:CAMPEP_0172153894 /NCGR_PEP_ID=MMETSP1050-20130122/1715_1 /TAXON_ID=233186 /ORGANISM="Cryptomonas curvata, Strain CCAP979/52" /LENGTH=149 /DNA_ID=CAMNT_0012822515 /DNA_START=113 /DNA_END=559 /DNA_ORIENTATION=+
MRSTTIILALLYLVPCCVANDLVRFSFDRRNCHETISVLEGGLVIEKRSGDDYQSVFMTPPIPLKGRSYVEFLIERQAEWQCFMGFGVSAGTHDWRGGRSAMAAENAWMLSTHSGKVYENGGEGRQFLPGIGTYPFFPGDSAESLGSVR